jgi:hypothetical protein
MVTAIGFWRCPYCSHKSLVVRNAGPCVCPKCGKTSQPPVTYEISLWIWFGVVTVLYGSFLLLR